MKFNSPTLCGAEALNEAGMEAVQQRVRAVLEAGADVGAAVVGLQLAGLDLYLVYGGLARVVIATPLQEQMVHEHDQLAFGAAAAGYGLVNSVHRDLISNFVFQHL